MAKKHQQRAHVSVRKKQEQEQKQQQRKEYLKKNKKKICILAVLAVIIIAGAILMIDYFGGPKGAMKVFMGKVQDVAQQVNDTYLKTFSEESGVQSYGEVADYLIAYYLQKAA